jgi:hypothetical protein
MYAQKRCAHSKVNFIVSSYESTCEQLQAGLVESRTANAPCTHARQTLQDVPGSNITLLRSD